MMRAAIFDFGGTIDTNGIHWSEKFWDVYNSFNINISKDDFLKAYINTEQKLEERTIILPDDSLKKTLFKKLSLQFDFLLKNNLLEENINVEEIKEKILFKCLDDVEKNIQTAKNVFERIKDKYKPALVSNYYGNINTILKEYKIEDYFEIVIDSTEIGIRKPDKGIFEKAINYLAVVPEDIFVIGDSFKNDIQPAKEIGCKTIWLKVKGWKDENKQNGNADHIINDFSELLNIL